MTDYATRYIKPNDRLTSFERLEIYNRQYWFRVLGCMAEDFPGLRAILGQWRFDDMCRAYLAERPSRSFTLRNLGARLETWLRRNPKWTRGKQTLALDMVRLEWADIEAFDGNGTQVDRTDIDYDNNVYDWKLRQFPTAGRVLKVVESPTAFTISAPLAAGAVARITEIANYFVVSKSDMNVPFVGLQRTQTTLSETINGGPPIPVSYSNTSIESFDKYGNPSATVTEVASETNSVSQIVASKVVVPTFDYTHRLLDQGLADDPDAAAPLAAPSLAVPDGAAMRPVTDLLADDDLIERFPATGDGDEVGDLTREPLSFPAERDVRLQNLARGDEGFLLALGYSTQRGYGRTHPFAGEIRFGEVEVEFFAEEVGFAVPLGTIAVTECQMVNQFKGSATEPPRFTRGYGLTFGQSERKAMSMALVDRALRARELGEDAKAPAQDEEFVLSHSDNVQATGFVEHLKLPHHVDFQAELGLVRQMREDFIAGRRDGGSVLRDAAE